MRERLWMFLVLSCHLTVTSGTLHNVYWNSSWFSSGPPTGRRLEVKVGDSIRIVCPYENGRQDKGGYLAVKQVSEMSYNECLIESSARDIIMCDRPSQTKDTTYAIRRYNPSYKGFEFIPGHQYYWISTSRGDREGLDGSMYGLCQTERMRLKIDVIDDSIEKGIQNGYKNHPKNVHSLREEREREVKDVKEVKDGGVETVLGWIDKGMEGTFTYNTHQIESSSEDVSGWENIPMKANQVMLMRAGDVDGPIHQQDNLDYIISEANTMASSPFSIIHSFIFLSLFILYF